MRGFRTVDGGRSSDGRGTVRPLGVQKARPVHSSARAVCGEAEEFPFEQTTSVGRRDTPLPSSPHAGSNVRVQYASPIPRSDAHNMVAANGQVTRLLGGDGCRLAAVTADIWFGVDTGHDPGWRMKSSRPATADRDGPAPSVRRETLNGPRSCSARMPCGLSRVYSMLKGGSAFRATRKRSSGACAAHWHQRRH